MLDACADHAAAKWVKHATFDTKAKAKKKSSSGDETLNFVQNLKNAQGADFGFFCQEGSAESEPSKLQVGVLRTITLVDDMPRVMELQRCIAGLWAPEMVRHSNLALATPEVQEQLIASGIK